MCIGDRCCCGAAVVLLWRCCGALALLWRSGAAVVRVWLWRGGVVVVPMSWCGYAVQRLSRATDVAVAEAYPRCGVAVCRT